MGLFEFKKPKWRHKDPSIRLDAIKHIDPGDKEILFELGRDDPDTEVRWTAINHIEDLNILNELARDANQEDLPVIRARKENLLCDLIINCQDNEAWQDSLEQLTSRELLAKIAVKGCLPDLRIAAVDKIHDQQLLAEIVKQNCGKKPAMTAMLKITEEALLLDLRDNAASKTARRFAADKITEFEKEKSLLNHQEIIDKKLITFVEEAAQIENNRDIDSAALRFEEIMQEWQELDSEHTHPAYASFKKIFSDFEERHKEALDRRKIAREKAARHEQFQARMVEICTVIERVSCSTDKNAEAVKKQAVDDWGTLVDAPKFDMIPSESLTKRFADACRTFDTNRQKINKEKELIKDIGTQCTETQQLIGAQELKKAASRLDRIKKNLPRIELKYFNKALIEKLIADVSADLEQADKDIHTFNLTSREKICTQLENLLQAEKPHYIERQLQQLNDEWRQLAKLEGAKGKELEQRFQNIVDTLNEKLKTLEHEQDWELWANLKLKEQIKEQVVSLDQENNLETVVNVIKQSQAEWKTIGPVPHTESQQLWDEFQDACNRNFERAKPYLDDLKTRRAEAMDRRREICNIAKELAESNDWQVTTRTFKELQNEWKNLLHGSSRQEQKLYQQFRKSCDRFFERRKEHYNILDKERQKNLIAKEQLCEQAEQLAESPQPELTKKFKRLQSEWKKIGPVPHKNKDAVWKRFRKACDSFFEWRDAEHQKNLLQKKELCEEVEKLTKKLTDENDQQKIVHKITELQQQWKEIGPVPHAQQDVTWQRFKKACDRFFRTREKQIKAEQRQQHLNQNRKEELLAKAIDVASQAQDKKTAEILKKFQTEWQDIGPAPREANKKLDEGFKSLCVAFFEGNHQYIAEQKDQQFENQKKKESLCLRLENILGLSYDSTTRDKGSGLSLAEELKQAMQDNFMLAGRRAEKKDISGEVKKLEQEWKKIGPVSLEQTKILAERYQKALDHFYKNNQE